MKNRIIYTFGIIALLITFVVVSSCSNYRSRGKYTGQHSQTVVVQPIEAVTKSMTGAVIKAVIGLFIWIVLPRLIYKKRVYRAKTPQYFAHLACKIIGIAMIVFACIDLISMLLNLS